MDKQSSFPRRTELHPPYPAPIECIFTEKNPALLRRMASHMPKYRPHCWGKLKFFEDDD